MTITSKFPMKCSHCKGMKYIGDPYYGMSTWHVDVTCLVCGRSKDLSISELKKNLTILEKAFGYDK